MYNSFFILFNIILSYFNLFVLFYLIIFYLTLSFNLILFNWIYFISTLFSILDSQLSWESGKFQLARWSHEVALLSDRIWFYLLLILREPPHPQLSFFCKCYGCAVSPPSQYMLSFNVVRCPHPICSTHQEGMRGVPPFQYKFFCVVSPRQVQAFKSQIGFFLVCSFAPLK